MPNIFINPNLHKCLIKASERLPAIECVTVVSGYVIRMKAVFLIINLQHLAYFWLLENCDIRKSIDSSRLYKLETKMTIIKVGLEVGQEIAEERN